MRVLLVSPVAPPVGGIATWTQCFCDYFSKKDWDIHIVNTSLIGRRAKENQTRFFWDELVRNISIIGRFYREIRKHPIDIVHINSACSKFGLLRDLICVMLARKHKIIFHCHCNVEDQLDGSRLAKKMLALALKKAHKVITLNETSRAYIASYGCDRVQILPNFIARNDVARQHIIREEAKNLIYVGHIRKTKGLLEMLEAAKKMPEMEFSLVGPLYENIENIEFPSNVHLLGTKSKAEVISMLDDADVFLFPSYTEGFSNALLEAMARGLPVIASDVGANREKLENLGGIIIPARDSEAIAAAITQIQDIKLRQQMSEWNIQKVAAHYTTDMVMCELMNLLRG